MIVGELIDMLFNLDYEADIVVDINHPVNLEITDVVIDPDDVVRIVTEQKE